MQGAAASSVLLTGTLGKGSVSSDPDDATTGAASILQLCKGAATGACDSWSWLSAAALLVSADERAFACKQVGEIAGSKPARSVARAAAADRSLAQPEASATILARMSFRSAVTMEAVSHGGVLAESVRLHVVDVADA